MNAYTTRGQARIQPHDLAAVRRADGLTAGGSLMALERQRGCQAEAEVDWLVKHNGVTPDARVARLAATADDRGGVDSRWRPPRGRPAECRLAGNGPRAAGCLSHRSQRHRCVGRHVRFGGMSVLTDACLQAVPREWRQSQAPTSCSTGHEVSPLSRLRTVTV